jgi:hypothetical protein
MKGGTFIVVGGLVLAGVAGYIIYKQLTRTKSGDDNKEPQHKTMSNEGDTTVTTTEINTEFSDIKDNSATSVNARHYAALQTIKESLTNITGKDEEVIVTDNSATLDKTSSDLDDLLK